MNKIKLHGTEGNPAPELKVLPEEELDGIRVDNFQNIMTRTEAELGKMSPNLQVKLNYLFPSFLFSNLNKTVSYWLARLL